MSFDQRPPGAICKRCGSFVSAERDFCQNCGYPVEKEPRRTTPLFVPVPFPNSPDMPGAWPNVPATPFGPQGGAPGVPYAPASPQAGAPGVPYAPAGPQAGAPGVPYAPAGPQAGIPGVPHAPAGPQGGWPSGQLPHAPVHPGSGAFPHGPSGPFHPGMPSGPVYPPSGPLPPTQPVAPGSWTPPPSQPMGPPSGQFPQWHPIGTVPRAPSTTGQIAARTASTSIRAAKTGFSLAKLFIVLAVVGTVAGGSAVALAARHHNLPQGYLYQAQANQSAGFIYFDIQESWYGGSASGTIYDGYADCQAGGQVTDVNFPFDGSVSDQQILLNLKISVFGVSLGSYSLTFSRMGNDAVLSQANLLGYSFSVSPQPDTTFHGVSESYDQVKQAACSNSG